MEGVRELVHKQCGAKGPKQISGTKDFCPLPSFKGQFLWDPNYVKYVEARVKENGSTGVKMWLDPSDRKKKGGQVWGQTRDAPTPFYSLAKTACPITADVMRPRN